MTKESSNEATDGKIGLAGAVELTEDTLDAVSGGPNRRKFDHIGNVVGNTPSDPLTGQPTGGNFASTASGSPNT